MALLLDSGGSYPLHNSASLCLTWRLATTQSYGITSDQEDVRAHSLGRRQLLLGWAQGVEIHPPHPASIAYPGSSVFG